MTAARGTSPEGPALPDATLGGSPALGPGMLMVIGSCVSLQLGAAFATRLFPVLGAWGVSSLRLGFAAVVLLLIARPLVRGWSWAQWRAVVLFALALAGMNGFFYAAIERIPLSAAVAVEFLGPLVLSAAISRRRTDFLWVLLALAGMVVLGMESVLGTASLDLGGVMLALLAGAFWAGYVLTSANVGQAVPGTGGLAMAMTVAALVLLPVGGPSALGAFGDARLLGLALLTGLLSSVVPYTLELAALRRVPKNVFSIFLSLEPAFAALFGFLLLAQPVGPLRLIAISLVVAASVGTTASTSAAARKHRAEARHAGPSEDGLLVEVPAEPLSTGALPIIDWPLPEEETSDPDPHSGAEGGTRSPETDR